jgi:hypothetical protein
MAEIHTFIIKKGVERELVERGRARGVVERGY